MKLRRPGGLWLHRDFRSLWAAETISVFGPQISQLALPLVAVITLEASAFEVALLGVIEFAPFILISLPAGVWVDRMRRKPLLVIADLGRAVLLASIPVAYWLDVLTIWQLYVVGFARRGPDRLLRRRLPVLPALARRARPARRRATRSSRSAAPPPSSPARSSPACSSRPLTARRGGAGRRDQLLRSPRSSSSGSGARSVPDPSRTQGRRRDEGGSEARACAGSSATATCAGSRRAPATFNFFGNIIGAVYLVFAVRVLGLRPGVIGLVFAVSSIGYLVGALAREPPLAPLRGRADDRLGAAGSVSLLLLALAPASNPIPFLIAAQAISGMGVPIYNITQVSFRQAITPERLQGRMNSVMRFIVWGVMPLGALLGGALASWVGAALRDLGRRDRRCRWRSCPVLLSPVRTLREMPEPVEEPLPSEADASGGLVAVGRGSAARGAFRLTSAALYRSPHARATRGRGVGARARPARVGSRRCCRRVRPTSRR